MSITRAVRRQYAIDRRRETYQTTVYKQFKRTWRHDTTCPEVKAIYKIIITETSLGQYQQHLYEVFPCRI